MRKTSLRQSATSKQSVNIAGDEAVLAHLPVKAFELLAAQPTSLVGLSQFERDQIVISAVVDGNGREHVVSRLGDLTWDLTVGSWAPNTAASGKKVSWPSTGSEAFFDDVKAVFYLWLKKGRAGAIRPLPNSLVSRSKQTHMVIAYFKSKGLHNFSEVTALHISDFITEIRKTRPPRTIASMLYFIDLVWHFQEEVTWPLPHDPWAGGSLVLSCGVESGRGGWNGASPSGLTAKTPVIPPSVQALLFRHAEAHLNLAEQSLSKRDSPGGHATSFALTALRDAIAYLIQITTGMRRSELAGIKSGCWRTEIRSGSVYHWIRTEERKTKKGIVDYLAPPEAINALEVLDKYARPFQERLKAEILWLEAEIGMAEEGAEILPSGMKRVDALQRLMVARDSTDNLFLANGKKYKKYSGLSRIEVLSGHGLSAAMDRFALAAGVTWKLASHQCRRTFAWTVANTRMGRRGLIFLKWQLKHSTMSMTQLYGSNPNQDDALYDEFYAEMVAAQCEVLESWFEDEATLSGGAGKRILKTRAMPVNNFSSLLELTAQSVTIRGTGHSWCLAEGGACVGEGVYEAIRCGDCSDGVIDSSHTVVWQGIHIHNLELLKVKDGGPAVQQRAKRAVSQSAQVLRELGVAVPPSPSGN